MCVCVVDPVGFVVCSVNKDRKSSSYILQTWILPSLSPGFGNAVFASRSFCAENTITASAQFLFINSSDCSSQKFHFKAAPEFVLQNAATYLLSNPNFAGFLCLIVLKI